MNNKPRIIAIIGTIVIHVLILVISLTFVVTHTPHESQSEEWPPVDSSEILFGGEYVMLGDVEQPTTDEAQQPAAQAEENEVVAAEQITDAGTPGTPPQPQPSTNESPMKVTPKPVEKPGPTKEELEAQEKARIEKEKAQQIKDQTKNAFAGKGKGTDENGGGKQGNKEGNNPNGSVTGSPGHNLGGRTIESWGRPSSKKTGVIRIAVVVSPQGKVTQAKYAGGEGAAASDESIRRSCESAALKSKFSVSKTETKVQRGTITWRFK